MVSHRLYLPAAVLIGLALAGCSPDPWDQNPPQPKQACVATQVEHSMCGRGGGYACDSTVCVAHALACPPPLELQEKAERGYVTMVCRLKK